MAVCILAHLETVNSRAVWFPYFLEMNLPNTLQNRPSKDAIGQERWRYGNETLPTLEVNLKSSLKRKELNAGTWAAPALERLHVQPPGLSKEQKRTKQMNKSPSKVLGIKGWGWGKGAGSFR